MMNRGTNRSQIIRDAAKALGYNPKQKPIAGTKKVAAIQQWASEQYGIPDLDFRLVRAVLRTLAHGTHKASKDRRIYAMRGTFRKIEKEFRRGDLSEITIGILTIVFNSLRKLYTVEDLHPPAHFQGARGEGRSHAQAGKSHAVARKAANCHRSGDGV